MTDQPCPEVPFDEVEKWEKIQGSCARLYAAAEWGYKQALATPPPKPPTDGEGKKTNLQQAAESALQTLGGWENYGSWKWPVSALEQVQRSTKESLDLLRTALATPPPEPPTDEELKEWYHQWAKSTSWWGHGDRPVHFARAVLERWGK